jgi:hypothetical protein
VDYFYLLVAYLHGFAFLNAAKKFNEYCTHSQARTAPAPSGVAANAAAVVAAAQRANTTHMPAR